MIDIPYDDLDPGIRKTVKWLNEMGFETYSSGDGKTKLEDPDYDVVVHEYATIPHVFIHVPEPSKLVDETDRLYRLILRVMGEVFPHMGEEDDEGSLLASYDPTHGTPRIVLVNVYDEILDPYDQWLINGERE